MDPVSGTRVRLRIAPAPDEAAHKLSLRWPAFTLALVVALLAGAVQQIFLTERACSWLALALILLATLGVGWLYRSQEREQFICGEGLVSILLDQLQRAALAYNVYPDRMVWHGSSEPLFDLARSALFPLGLGFATLRLADRRFFPFITWSCGAIIMRGNLLPFGITVSLLIAALAYFVTQSKH